MVPSFQTETDADTNPTHMPPTYLTSPVPSSPTTEPCFANRISHLYQQCIFIFFNNYQQTLSKIVRRNSTLHYTYPTPLHLAPLHLAPCTLHPALTLCPGHWPGLASLPFPPDRSIDHCHLAITITVTPPTHSRIPSMIRDMWNCPLFILCKYCPLNNCSSF